MRKYNTPTVAILWPNVNSVDSKVGAKLLERLPFKPESESGLEAFSRRLSWSSSRMSFQNLESPKMIREVWRDPLEEQDLIMVTDLADESGPSEPGNFQTCCDILNQSNLDSVNNFVTFAVAESPMVESGFQVSVAATRPKDAMRLDRRIHLYDHPIPGPAGTLLRSAKQLGRSAYCIVIETAPGTTAPGTTVLDPSAIEAALDMFTQVTAIETQAEMVDSQVIQMHRCLKELAKGKKVRV